MEKVLVIIELDGKRYGARIPVDATVDAIMEHLSIERGVKIQKNKVINAEIPVNLTTPLDQIRLREGMIIKLTTNAKSSEIEKVDDSQLEEVLRKLGGK